MTDRTPCVVPHCRRTCKGYSPDQEWICSDHWRLVDRRLRRVYSIYRRRWKKTGEEVWPFRAEMLWLRQIKRQAIERAAGI